MLLRITIICKCALNKSRTYALYILWCENGWKTYAGHDWTRFW